MAYEIRNEAVEAAMRAIATAIKEFAADKLGPEWGFSVQVYRYDGDGFFYMSSGAREDTVRSLRNLADKLEAEGEAGG